MESNREQGILYEQPRSLDARQAVAEACRIGLRLTIPTLLDTMDNAADRVYQGWPERLYVLSPTGQVVYQGGKGPYGFDPDALERFLAEYLIEKSK